MLYLRINEVGEVKGISAEMPDALKKPGGPWARGKDGVFGVGWLNRNDIDCYEMAEDLAKSASKLMGEVYLAEDSGPYVSPRYDVFLAPKVGDDVSKAFNGDYYYPVGKIVKIGKDYSRLYIDGPRGKMVAYRRKLSARFLIKGMWSVVPGVIDERNPSF